MNDKMQLKIIIIHKWISIKIHKLQFAFGKSDGCACLGDFMVQMIHLMAKIAIDSLRDVMRVYVSVHL